MNELNWTRKDYETWEDAFRALTPQVRQQSVRVAAYTQALFLQACADGFAAGTPDGAARIKSQYGDLAYKCGLYHQLGKALVPPEYQILQEDYTDEETAVYRKYTSDGRLLVATLQERAARAKQRRKGDLSVEQPTSNIPHLMLRESCQQHMERWDGSGYPDGRLADAISPIAQIVGLAKELDRLAAETKAEEPFEDAFRTLLSQENTLWNPALLEVLKHAKPKCRAVYKKYIEYTLTLPKTVPLVERRKDRPMGLRYRPMVSGADGTVVAYEAIPWFGGIADRPGEDEPLEEVAQMLSRTRLVGDVSYYFLYEAADTVLRIRNCKLELAGLLVQMHPDFYTQGTQLGRLNQLFADEGIEKKDLMLTLPEQTFLQLGKGAKELLERYLRAGIVLVLDGFHPGSYDPDELKRMGFTHLRLHPETYLQQLTASRIGALRAMGFTILGKEADTHDALAWLEACGAAYMSGTLSGVPVSEDELIRDCLARER